jgi:hypothetical protein
VEQPAVSNVTEQPAAPAAAVLFDIDLRIVKSEIFSSEKLSAVVSLTNIGKAGKVDANLDYAMTDANGNIVYSETEVVPVETQMQFIKEFDVSQLGSGKYTLTADLQYLDQHEPASSRAAFTVKPAVSVTGQLLSPSDVKTIIVVAIFAAFFVVYIVFYVIKKKSLRI